MQRDNLREIRRKRWRKIPKLPDVQVHAELKLENIEPGLAFLNMDELNEVEQMIEEEKAIQSGDWGCIMKEILGDDKNENESI